MGIITVAASESEIAKTQSAGGVELTDEKIELFIEWFNCIQNLDDKFMDRADYALAKELYEINAGRTPELLPKADGGKGLGYFEDLLLPPGLAAEWDEAAMRQVMSQPPAWTVPGETSLVVTTPRAKDLLPQRVDGLSPHHATRYRIWNEGGGGTPPSTEGEKND